MGGIAAQTAPAHSPIAHFHAPLHCSFLLCILSHLLRYISYLLSLLFLRGMFRTFTHSSAKKKKDSVVGRPEGDIIISTRGPDAGFISVNCLILA
jgi:hypothetical protein